MHPQLMDCNNHSVKNLLFSNLLSKNIKMKVYRILPAVLYGCETWSLTFGEESKIKIFVNS